MWEVNAPSLIAWVYACLPVQLLNHISDFYETWYAHCHYANTADFHLFVNNTIIIIIIIIIRTTTTVSAQTCEPARWRCHERHSF